MIYLLRANKFIFFLTATEIECCCFKSNSAILRPRVLYDQHCTLLII